MTGLRVGFSNSLSRTLAHYEDELEDTLRRIGAVPVEVRAGIAEGRQGMVGKVETLGAAANNVRRIWSADTDLTLVLWPTLGLYELPLQRSRRIAVVLHDPNPITDQFGYGRVARGIAKRMPRERLPLVVVHSTEGAKDARAMVPNAEIITVAQPVLTVVEMAPRAPNLNRVLVAGQYKPTRNVELLNAIGPALVQRGIEAFAVGRGWSAHLNDSWQTDDRFISEDEMGQHIMDASLVLIPYSRYYQSNIALRAIELGTPVLGEMNSFMSMLYAGGDNVIPVDSSTDVYLSAIDSLLARPGGQMDAYERYRSRVDADWGALLSQVARM